jgi:hypothetical protein
MDAELEKRYGALTHLMATKSLHQETTDMYIDDTKLKFFISKE